MKTLFAALIFVAGTTQAQVYFKSVPICTSWNFTSGGYLCSSYPMSEAIPDQYSLNNKIRDLESRIQVLEKKLAQALQQ